jgi:hypothetical protein
MENHQVAENHSGPSTSDNPLGLSRAPRSRYVRVVRSALRQAWRQPLSRWVGRPPAIVVRVPPLDGGLVAAIHQVAPHFDWMRADERSRRAWEQDQNSSCWREDVALGPLLMNMPPPRRVLELGPGLGRSTVFFSQRYFPDAQFDLFDSVGGVIRYETLGPRYEDSFCGDLHSLRLCLDYNGVRRTHILDAKASAGRIPCQAEPYDFIYSFYAIGYHWSLDHWLDEVLAVCHPGTLCAFGVHEGFNPSARLRALPHVLLEASPPLLPLPWKTSLVFAFTPERTAWLHT